MVKYIFPKGRNQWEGEDIRKLNKGELGRCILYSYMNIKE
jgi:hypothetical protein